MLELGEAVIISRADLLNTKPELPIVGFVYSQPHGPTSYLGLILSVTL